MFVFTGITILMSLTVFLNMVVEIMPVTSDNPLLGKDHLSPHASNNDKRDMGTLKANLTLPTKRQCQRQRQRQRHLENTLKEQPKRLVTFETFDWSDEKT